MKKFLNFFFPLNRLSGKMKKIGDFTFFFIPLLSFYASTGQRLLEKALERPRRGNIHVFHCVFFSFFAFALTADQPLVRAWEMKKVFFFIFALLSPSGPQQNEKVGAKNTGFHFFFHCSALTAVPRGMEKKKVLDTTVKIFWKFF